MKSADTNFEAVMRRVQKLLAIASDSRADPNEAAAAARMAESVMRKYQIEHADLVAEQLRAGDHFDEVDVNPTMSGRGAGARRVPGWSASMSIYIAQLMDCQTVLAKKPGAEWMIRYRGFKADVAVAVWMHHYLAGQMRAACDRFASTYVGALRAEMTAYRAGYITAVCQLLTQAHQDKLAEMAEASGSRALMVIKSTAVDERYGSVKHKTRTRETSQVMAHLAGLRDGASADISRQALGSTHQHATQLAA